MMSPTGSAIRAHPSSPNIVTCSALPAAELALVYARHLRRRARRERADVGRSSDVNDDQAAIRKDLPVERVRGELFDAHERVMRHAAAITADS
jgi:hypothetical protein